MYLRPAIVLWKVRWADNCVRGVSGGLCQGLFTLLVYALAMAEDAIGGDGREEAGGAALTLGS